MAARRTTVAPFDDTINLMPFSPSTDEGKGFLPPLLRGMGHILALLSAETVTPDDVTHELEETQKHWTQIVIDGRFSDKAKEYLGNLNQAVLGAQAEHTGWDETVRTEKLRNLTNRSMGLVSLLDREALGIRETDPGLNV